jgi:hypothetical protein
MDDHAISKKEIHRAVRNVLANEMQITPELIQHIAITVIESKINQYFNNFDIDKFIENRVREQWRTKPYTASDFTPNIQRAIQNCIERAINPVIEQWVKNQVNVQISTDLSP